MPGGAPRGNQNARKHGYYSKVPGKASRVALDQAACISGIDGEIALLRFHIRELLEKEPDNLKLHLQAASILGRLLKTRYQLGGAQQDRLKEAMHKVMTEIGVPFGVAPWLGRPGEAARPQVTKDGTEKNAV